MLHPLKVRTDPYETILLLTSLESASSYECDGCAHHASFHSMENKTEDEVRKRWEQEAKDKADQENEVQQRPKKRARAIEYSQEENISLEELTEILRSETRNSRAAGRGRGAAVKKPSRAAAAKAKSRVTEVLGDDEVIEVD
jgi:hypothetical protein